MRKLLMGLILAGTVLLMPASAAAHVVVKPAKVAVGDFQTFSTSVPNEKDVLVTSIRVVVPEGVAHVTPTVKPGWEISTKKSGDTVTEITWSNGAIPAGMRDDFTFSAQAPAKQTTLHWKAYQSYEDGSTVAWDKSAEGDAHDESGTSGPESTTAVVDDLSEPTSGDSSSQPGPYIIAAIALIISVIAITTKSKVK